MDEWISVNSELPELGKRVLLYRKNNPITVGWHVVNIYGTHGFGLPFGHAPMDDITHWMPLPEPPEGE